MNRNSCIDALVIASTSVGEDHRSITVLAPDRGVFQAMLYGGRKSRLRSLVSPYHRGRMWLYTDTVRQCIKITDFDVISFHPEIRENLYKTWAAALCAELLVKTRCSGEYEQAWILANAFLDGISVSSETESRAGTLRFLWRYLTMMGLQPELSECLYCGNPLGSSRHAWFLPLENACICDICRYQHETIQNRLPLGTDALQYLHALSTDTPAAVRDLHPGPETMQELHRFLFCLVPLAADNRLKTLDTGLEIL
jgi:DNA repair protein RecO (recombination protein O)